jgi:hypothetical protein
MNHNELDEARQQHCQLQACCKPYKAYVRSCCLLLSVLLLLAAQHSICSCNAWYAKLC